MGTGGDTWDVSDSDEEGVDLKSEKILELYQQIAKDGYIELQGKYPRREKPTAENPDCADKIDSDETVDESSGKEAADEEKAEATELDRSAVVQGFDYDEENSENTSLPVRTPKSGKKTQKKRIGSFDNVVSNIHRFRQMNAAWTDKDKDAVKDEASEPDLKKTKVEDETTNEEKP